MPLLKLARDSGRVVILASDHGHVWHRPDARASPRRTGSRWRPNPATFKTANSSITGSRVRDEAGSNAVIVPWTETIYYERQQNGYHGGATPQEMVCPLVILTRTRAAPTPACYPCEYPKPEWWSSAPVATAVGRGTARCRARLVPSGPTACSTTMRRGSEAGRTTRRSRSAADSRSRRGSSDCFASQAYKDQKELVRRHAPEDELVRRCLEALDASGGIMTPAAFSKAADVPAGTAGRLDRPDATAAERGWLRNPDLQPHREPDRTERRETEAAVRSGMTLWKSAANADERSSPPCGKGPFRSVGSISLPWAWAASSR